MATPAARRPSLADALEAQAIVAAMLGRGDQAERLTAAAETRRAAA